MNDIRGVGITDKAPWGQHIPLRCKNHPECTYSTKNIHPIGARSLFYTGKVPECQCSIEDLVVAEDLMQKA